MEPQKLHKLEILICSILVLFAFTEVYSYFVRTYTISNNPLLAIEDTEVLNAQELSGIDLPMRLKIPSIGVDAPIEHLDLTEQNTMAVPKGSSEVAWFDQGPLPGEIGNAVIAGHFGWKNNIPAVFDNLHKLQYGDKIIVENESGSVTTFIVREMKTYTKDESAPEVFTSEDDISHLNLVTCSGAWDYIEKSRAGRLVVYTDKEVFSPLVLKY